MKFDKELSRKNLLEFSIPYEMDEKFDPLRPMGNAARSKVFVVVMAAFIGEFDRARLMLPRAIEWLSGAIERGEELGRSKQFHQYKLSEALAVARWLDAGDSEKALWRAAMQLELSVAGRPEGVYTANDMRAARLDAFLPLALLCGEFEIAYQECQKIHSSGDLRLKPGLSPRKYGCLVARLINAAEFEPEVAFAAGKLMLSKVLDDWLSHGDYALAVKWVLVVYVLVGGYEDPVDAMRDAFSLIV